MFKSLKAWWARRRWRSWLELTDRECVKLSRKPEHAIPAGIYTPGDIAQFDIPEGAVVTGIRVDVADSQGSVVARFADDFSDFYSLESPILDRDMADRKNKAEELLKRLSDGQ